MPALVNLDTANTVWRQGTNQVTVQDGHRALLRAIVHFAAGKALPGTVTYSGTGTGTINDIDGGVDAPTETWTIEFTDATNFTVTGSVSGAQAAGTVGQNYTTTGNPLTSLISFRITAGGTAFVATDSFTIPVTEGPLASDPDQWILDRWSPFTTAGNGFNAINDRASTGTTGSLIWHGQGNGSEAWHAGIALAETPASQIWNFVQRAYTGFSPSQNWDTNLNASDEVFSAAWNNDMTYWVVVNSRRIASVWVVSTTMHAFYQGAILPFASPAEWPFPMCLIGEKDDEEAWNSTAAAFTHGFVNPSESNAVLRDTAGNWLEQTDQTQALSSFPGSTAATVGGPRSWWDNHENFPSGDNQLFPLTFIRLPILNQPLTMDTLGVPQGVYIVTGFNITPQTVLTIDSVDYLVVNDIFRTERDDFWALELS